MHQSHQVKVSLQIAILLGTKQAFWTIFFICLNLNEANDTLIFAKR